MAPAPAANVATSALPGVVTASELKSRTSSAVTAKSSRRPVTRIVFSAALVSPVPKPNVPGATVPGL